MGENILRYKTVTQKCVNSHTHTLTRCIPYPSTYCKFLLFPLTPQISQSWQHRYIVMIHRDIVHLPVCFRLLFFFLAPVPDPNHLSFSALPSLSLFLYRIRTIRQLQPTGGHRHQTTAQWQAHTHTHTSMSKHCQISMLKLIPSCLSVLTFSNYGSNQQTHSHRC